MQIRRGAVTGMAAVVAMLALGSSPVHGQATGQPRTYRQMISLNPLGIPFEYLSGEYEVRTSALTTIGVALSYLDLDPERYTTIEGKLRFYPNEETFKGFSIGLSAGVTKYSDLEFDSGFLDEQRVTETRATIGVIVDYNWLLGKSKRMLVGTGIGAKRLLREGSTGLGAGYPTLRFQVGVMF